MARGMRRTTIMSHGRMHNAKGVKGTHLRGTVPSKTVLDAIPEAQAAVGDIPETQRPGDANAKATRTPMQVRPGKKYIDAEGDPYIPGGTHDPRGGPATMRPQIDASPLPERSSSGQVPADVVPPVEPETTDPVEAPEEAQETREEAPPAPAVAPLAPPTDPEPSVAEDASSEPQEPDASDLSVPMPDTRRKLVRAKNEVLREWCVHLKIVPEEYADTDDGVTGDMMRQLIAEAVNIDW